MQQFDVEEQRAPVQTQQNNNEGILATTEFLFNGLKYSVGASFGFCIVGFLVGMGCGYAAARYTSPCIDKENTDKVKLCAWNSEKTTDGMLAGSLIVGGLTFFVAAANAKEKGVARREELSFISGVSDGCSAVGACLSAMDNR